MEKNAWKTFEDFGECAVRGQKNPKSSIFGLIFFLNCIIYL